MSCFYPQKLIKYIQRKQLLSSNKKENEREGKTAYYSVETKYGPLALFPWFLYCSIWCSYFEVGQLLSFC